MKFNNSDDLFLIVASHTKLIKYKTQIFKCINKYARKKVSDQENDNTPPFKRYDYKSVLHGKLKSMQNETIVRSDIKKGSGRRVSYA